MHYKKPYASFGFLRQEASPIRIRRKMQLADGLGWPRPADRSLPQNDRSSRHTQLAL